MFRFHVPRKIENAEVAAIAFLAFAFVFGGSSRADTFGPVIVNLASIGLLVGALWVTPVDQFRRIAKPLLFLAAIVVLLLFQLIPLPPSVWTALPGRNLFVDSALISGLAQVWRPVSLSPDLTLTSALAMLPPIALLLAILPLSSSSLARLLPTMIALIVASAFLGTLQLLANDGTFYIYQITNIGAPVGFFANRNHEALMLVMIFPALGAYGSMNRSRWSLWFVAVTSFVILPITLATGSRSGLLLLFVGLVGGWLLYTNGELIRMKGSRLRFNKGLFAALIGVVGMIALTVLLARAPSVQRLFDQDIAQEVRVQLFAPMMQIGWTYFPFGTGVGTFVPIFKIHEPLNFLSPLYLNHAHNELLELFIETGIFGIALLAIFIGWWVSILARVWRPSAIITKGVVPARLGSIWTCMILLLSLADYPLRTPTFAVVFALGCGWMAIWDSGRKRDRRRTNRDFT